MNQRAEGLVAKSWQRAQRNLLQTEGFLEDALAAALEAPGVWERLLVHLDLPGDVPKAMPAVSTQDSVEEGRTDITLRWSDGCRIVLELKIADPPHREQIERYLQSGVHVIAIARLPGHFDIDEVSGRRFIGLFTWSRLRTLEWEDAPLQWRQLLRLLDATGVVMPKIEREELEGILRSWNTWDALQEWSWKGMEAAQEVLRSGGLECVSKEKKRQRVQIDMSHQRLVWWMWPPPWREDYFAIYAGFFMGRPKDPVIQQGVPDLMLSFHVDPNSARGILLRTDGALKRAVGRWTSRPASAERREPRLDSTTWEVLRCRESAQYILDATDPGMFVVKWMKQRAQEWVDDRIASRIAAFVESE